MQLTDVYDASAYKLSMPQAGSGFNVFRGGGGNDTIIGNGNTRLDFGSATTGITFDFGRKRAGDGQGGIDTYSGCQFRRRDGLRRYPDRLRKWHETFTGGSGDDQIEGGAGNDEARYDGGTSPITIGITVDMAAGTVAGDAISIANDPISGFEGIRGRLLEERLCCHGVCGRRPDRHLPRRCAGQRELQPVAGLSGKDRSPETAIPRSTIEAPLLP